MIIDMFVAILLSLGALFFLLGTVALLRFPDVYTRLHGVTKCDTLGLGLILLGLMLHEGATIASAKMLFIIIFVFITSPTAAHALVRATYKHGVKMWDKTVLDRYGELSHGDR
jgi:multicomponent Na+:H+ antiporter subunit G